MREIKIEDMDEFKCHKVVRAAYIIDMDPGTNTLLTRTGTIQVPMDFIGERRAPGYLVRYEDGYLSWSPVKAFEEGYTRI